MTPEFTYIRQTWIAHRSDQREQSTADGRFYLRLDMRQIAHRYAEVRGWKVPYTAGRELDRLLFIPSAQ